MSTKQNTIGFYKAIIWIFGQFDTWYQVATTLGISAAIVWAPGFIVDFVGEGIMFLKMALSELSI